MAILQFRFPQNMAVELMVSPAALTFHLPCLTAVADAIRTSLGPKGMDKMVSEQTFLGFVLTSRSSQVVACVSLKAKRRLFSDPG